MSEAAVAVVKAKGAERWKLGHPWIYRSDVAEAPSEPGVVRVTDRRGKFLACRHARWRPGWNGQHP